MTRIKVCGLTRSEDVEACLELGVDALGFNFVPGTPRALPEDRARELSELARGRARRVGVFQDAEFEWVRDLAQRVDLDCIQLHGDEPPGWLAALEWPVIKVLRGNLRGIDAAGEYAGCELLLDHPSGGGSGKAWDFELASKLIASGRQVWIAGGLGVENVALAIGTAHPFGVDACSGLESAPGIKDPERLRGFVESVRAV